MKTENLLEKLYGHSPVKVIHGANDGEFDIAGTTVGNLMTSLVDAFNIPADALAFVNGEQVDPSYRLLASDTLEFVKQYGEKSILDPDEKAQLDRIESMLNRLFVKPADHVPVAGDNDFNIKDILTYGPILVNKTENEVTVDGKTYALDLVQIEVLASLVARKGEWVTRQDMRDSSRILHDEEHIERIIKALKNKVKAISPLITSSARGYRLVLPPMLG